MKGCSFSIWIGVNLVVIATLCYIGVVINLQSKSDTHPPSNHKEVDGWSPKNDRPDHSHTLKVNRSQSFVFDKLERHKHHVISQLRFSLINHRKRMSAQSKSSTQFRLVASRVAKEESPQQLLCDLKKVLKKSHFKLLSSKYAEFEKNRHFFKDSPLIKDKIRSCAIVSSAGSMLESELGQFIDDHDVVVRFNNAPVLDYENDVGNKTTIRILNSQILSKPHFQFVNSSLYENISLAVWDPIGYNLSLEEWIKKPDFPFLQTFFSRRQSNLEEDLHLIDPRGLWDLWHYINQHSPLPIPPNPPSSGFIGLALILPFCDYVDMVEFIPSFRMTKRCHYYSNHEDIGCTIGEWHPLAAEKLLYLALNEADEETTFQTGYVRITGFPKLVC